MLPGMMPFGGLTRRAPAGVGNDANTVVLIQNEGKADGSTTITNTAVGGSATFAALGTTQVDTDVPVNGKPSILFAEGGGLQFDASTSEFTFDGDFCIEFFLQTTTKTLDGAFQRRIFDFGGSHLACFLGTSNSGQVELDTPAGFKGTSDIADGNLHHVAILRTSGTLMIAVDGTVENSVANATVFTGEATAHFGRYQPSDNGHFVGSLGQIRISDIARYSPPFTPPAEAFG